MNLLQSLSAILATLMHEDSTRVVLGEDVADGTMLGLTRDAAKDPDLAPRLLPTPLSPSILPAHAAGLAAEGFRPLVIFPEARALLDGGAALREIARSDSPPEPSGGAPLVFLAPFGPGFGLESEASDSPEANLSGVAGVRVVVLSTPHEAGATLRAALEGWAGPEPTVLLIPRCLALAPVEPSSALSVLARPFASPRRVREGDAAAVFTWGACVARSIAAVEQSRHDARVIDVECVAPLDRRGLVEEAKATGRIVIAHGGPASGGVGAELAALFADEAILVLDAPIVRVTGTSGQLPDLEALRTAIDHVASY